jgi:hypothetical protein
MTLRQCQVLEALLAVEEDRPGGNVGLGAHPDEVKRELAAIRPRRCSANMIRQELRELGPRYVRERAGPANGFARPVLFTLTADGRVRARELAASRARLRQEARARAERNARHREGGR